jgi:4-diphosphocytidyl-2-C-methyl-D-erythritol kinase
MERRSADAPEVLPVRPSSEPLDGGLRLAAPAKINLNLLVGPLRADGYHQLDSYVARIALYDDVELRPRADGRLRFRCGGADCGPDEQNLALRAARLMSGRRAAAGLPRRRRREPGADVTLVKRIAPRSGLGGGSSDAAAVLRGLNELWDMALRSRGLRELAQSLGSDVPLFLGPPAARMTGRGDRLTAVHVRPFWAVLCLPDESSPTPEVYRAHDADPPARRTQVPAEVLATERPSAWAHRLVNQLAPAALRLRPQLAELRDELAAAAGRPIHLTGSGSAMFILCDAPGDAAAVFARLRQGLRRLCVVVRSNPW